MLLKDHMSASGARLFRWRSYVLLAFAPFILMSAFQGERIESMLGEGFGNAYELACIALVVLGEVIRIVTVGFVPSGTSGRNTTGQIADTLNTTGLYSLVRNPLYLGNCLMYLGVVLFTQNLLLAVVLVLVLLPYYERIIAAEEQFLVGAFGQTYESWAALTPAFLPRLTGWKAPAMRFSLLTVIRREHASVYGAVMALYLIELGMHSLGTGGDAFDQGWHWVLGVASVLELTVIILKRRTRVLDVTGR